MVIIKIQQQNTAAKHLVYCTIMYHGCEKQITAAIGQLNSREKIHSLKKTQQLIGNQITKREFNFSNEQKLKSS